MQPLWEQKELVQKDSGGCVPQEEGNNSKEEENGHGKSQPPSREPQREFPAEGMMGEFMQGRIQDTKLQETLGLNCLRYEGLMNKLGPTLFNI